MGARRRQTGGRLEEEEEENAGEFFTSWPQRYLWEDRKDLGPCLPGTTDLVPTHGVRRPTSLPPRRPLRAEIEEAFTATS